MLFVLLLFGSTALANAASTTIKSQTNPSVSYPLNLNETGIGLKSPLTANYPNRTVVTVNVTVPPGSPWCITMTGTGSGSFSGTIYPPVSNFTVTMYGPINETANFTQCGYIAPQLIASIRTAPTAQTNTTGQFLISGNWSGGVPPYSMILRSGPSPFCINDKTVVASNTSIIYNDFKALISQATPTYYCLNITDSESSTVLLPSVYVGIASQAARVASTTTTAPVTIPTCTPPYCGGHYTISTTVFPTHNPSSPNTTTSLTISSTVPTTTIPSQQENQSQGIIGSIISFFRGLFGLK